MKKRCENAEYADPMAAESAFRKFVEDEILPQGQAI
jgi:hypothetical protein